MYKRAAQAWEQANQALAEDWHYNLEFDRFFWGLTLCIYTVFTAKMVPQLSVQENIENLGIYLGVIGMAVITIRYPEACRRHTPLLRIAVLVYMYTMPILTSVDAMHAITPAPSTARYLAGVVDTITLWLSTSHLFCLWTIFALRPPLYLALPAQLFVLGRLTAADFCQAPVRGQAEGCAVCSGLSNAAAAAMCSISGLSWLAACAAQCPTAGRRN
jgi:hypothetical protein